MAPKFEKEPGQSWKEWRDDLPWWEADDQGWQTWYNRQGQQWGQGTTSGKRKEWRLAKGKGRGKPYPKEEAKEEVEEEAPLQKGSSASSSSAQPPLQKGPPETDPLAASSSSGGTEVLAFKIDVEPEVKTEVELENVPTPPLQKGTSSAASSVFPFGMNVVSIVQTAKPVVLKPTAKGTPRDKPPTFGAGVLGHAGTSHLVPLSPSEDLTSSGEDEAKRPKLSSTPVKKGTKIPLQKGTTTAATGPLKKGTSSASTGPLQKGTSSSSTGPLQKGTSSAARQVSTPKASDEMSMWFNQGYTRRKEELRVKREEENPQPKRAASATPQRSLAKGYLNEAIASSLIHKGVSKIDVDYWMERGSLDWNFPFPPGDDMHVGVDWHNTLQVGEGDNTVPTYNLIALEKLINNGFKVTILSYCFEKREAQVMDAAKKLRCAHSLESIQCCRMKTGVMGKTWLFKAYGITACFDDNRHVCQEALAKGLDTYPIMVQSQENHSWFRERRPYTTFASAVEDFLHRKGLWSKA